MLPRRRQSWPLPRSEALNRVLALQDAEIASMTAELSRHELYGMIHGRHGNMYPAAAGPAHIGLCRPLESSPCAGSVVGCVVGTCGCIRNQNRYLWLVAILVSFCLFVLCYAGDMYQDEVTSPDTSHVDFDNQWYTEHVPILPLPPLVSRMPSAISPIDLQIAFHDKSHDDLDDQWRRKKAFRDPIGQFETMDVFLAEHTCQGEVEANGVDVHADDLIMWQPRVPSSMLLSMPSFTTPPSEVTTAFLAAPLPRFQNDVECGWCFRSVVEALRKSHASVGPGVIVGLMGVGIACLVLQACMRKLSGEGVPEAVADDQTLRLDIHQTGAKSSFGEMENNSIVVGKYIWTQKGIDFLKSRSAWKLWVDAGRPGAFPVEDGLVNAELFQRLGDEDADLATMLRARHIVPANGKEHSSSSAQKVDASPGHKKAKSKRKMDHQPDLPVKKHRG